jgi:hypothetical protein
MLPRGMLNRRPRCSGFGLPAAAAYPAAELARDHPSRQVFDNARKYRIERAETAPPAESAKRAINWTQNRAQPAMGIWSFTFSKSK